MILATIKKPIRNLTARRRYGSARGHPPRTALESVGAALNWLCRAQATAGGFARSYSLLRGWELPYPETTGYIIPTLLARAAQHPDLQLRSRAQQAGEWLADVQFESGAICSKQWKPGNTTPSVFNTGMVLHGWVSLLEQQPHERLGCAARKAVDWLVEQQEGDGSWAKAAFNGIAHTYYTMVDWALLRYAVLGSDSIAREAALKNLDWALRQQSPNAWFDRCGFGAGEAVTTHTLSYTTQGLVESAILLDEGSAKAEIGTTGRRDDGTTGPQTTGPQDDGTTDHMTKESRKQKAEKGLRDHGTTDYAAGESGKQKAEMAPPSTLHSPLSALRSSPFALRLVEAAVRATEPLRRYFDQHGALPGTFDENWHPTAAWECCTGNAQTSLVWQALGRVTGDPKWAEAAGRLNLRLLQYQKVNCRVPGINGAVPGSWPIDGGYDSLAFPNHAAKFHVDALSAQS